MPIMVAAKNAGEGRAGKMSAVIVIMIILLSDEILLTRLFRGRPDGRVKGQVCQPVAEDSVRFDKVQKYLSGEGARAVRPRRGSGRVLVPRRFT
jgi:hypothetical protein